MTPFAVHVEGSGVAALCCAHLLSAKSIPVTASGSLRSTLPAILLNTATLRLLRDVAPNLDLSSVGWPIQTRVVQWGSNAEPVSLPHAGLVLSEKSLLQCLVGQAQSLRRTLSPPLPNWKVFCNATATDQTRHSFGTRLAHLAAVTLHPAADPHTCWVESLNEGWLFLLPTQVGAAVLIATGPNPQHLLQHSRLISPLLTGQSSPFVSAPAYPRIADPLYGPDWLACGGAAITFDPLCGEGTGHAVREAILVAAVLSRLKLGADRDPRHLLDHFRHRIIAGFQKHLETCRDFYRSGGNSSWWTNELASLDAGLRWTAAQLSSPAGPPFRLVDFDLQPQCR